MASNKRAKRFLTLSQHVEINKRPKKILNIAFQRKKKLRTKAINSSLWATHTQCVHLLQVLSERAKAGQERKGQDQDISSRKNTEQEASRWPLSRPQDSEASLKSSGQPKSRPPSYQEEHELLTQRCSGIPDYYSGKWSTSIWLSAFRLPFL